MPLPDLLERLTPTEQLLVDTLITGSTLWMPHPDNLPQIQAYVSEADILYFGGAAGGGKSDLLLGLALTAHKKSIIFRREFLQLRELIDRSQDILGGTRASYNQTFSRWINIPGGRTLEFGAVQHEKFKEKYKGRPHDLKAFDEVADFSESQFRFLVAWNRSTELGQRCRIVCAGNPPTHSAGEWVIRYWSPWLSEDHQNPAVPGELRWFASLDGRDVEVTDGRPFWHNDELITPLSRTFIPSFLDNNPFLRDTNYKAVLQGLPEPLRSHLLLGLFTVRAPDPPRQVIPSEWVRLAQRRWRERVPLEREEISVVGLDPSRGGLDKTEIAPRAGSYFFEVLSYPGVGVPDAPACVALVEEVLEDSYQDVQINLDVIGVGAGVYDLLVGLGYTASPVNFSSKASGSDKTGRLRFRNVRAEAYWKMREDLDPTSGKDLALPPGDELLADLVAPTWDMSARGIVVEPKKNVRKKLGRSPGQGDAVVLANYDPVMGVFFR